VNRILQALVLVLLLGITFGGPVSAATTAPAGGQVGNGTPLSCNETNFDNALVGGGAITFNCGGPKTITLSSEKSIGLDTTIDGGGAITLTGNLATRLFSVGIGVNFTLQNIVLDKGSSGSHVGGAIFSAGRLTLDHVLLQNSVAAQSGGGVYATGPVTIRDSRFHNNASGKSGGGLYEQNAVAVTIDNSGFDGNSAQDPSTGVGGAIALGNGAQLNVTDGTFYSNQAVLDGGALDLSAGATATILSGPGGSAFTLNHALAYGGAISNNGGVLNLVGVDFSFNQTLTDTVLIGFGGAIDNEGAMSVLNSNFNTNLGRFGGAVYVGSNVYPASASIQHTHFIANSAAQYGGALFADTVTTTVTITDASIEFNSATYGGGLNRINARLSIAKSSITSNLAQNGGGLGVAGLPSANSGPYVEVRDTTISDNLATSTFGGGINNSGLLDLTNVTIASNHNGLYNSSSDATARLQGTVLDNPGFKNCDGVATPSTSGHNLASDSTCSLDHSLHDLFPVTAGLGPLTSAPGVFTVFRMPNDASLTVGTGGPSCAPTDQRFALRFGACDMGAIQRRGLLPRIFAPLMRR